MRDGLAVEQGTTRAAPAVALRRASNAARYTVRRLKGRGRDGPSSREYYEVMISESLREPS
jgi:hypothetical protein